MFVNIWTQLNFFDFNNFLLFPGFISAFLRLIFEFTIIEYFANWWVCVGLNFNKIEAKGNWFQSSWRPLVGWVCAIAFAWHFVIQSLLVFAFTYAGAEVPDLPEFDMSALLTVLGGLLGLGSLRTFEKTRGINK